MVYLTIVPRSPSHRRAQNMRPASTGNWVEFMVTPMLRAVRRHAPWDSCYVSMSSAGNKGSAETWVILLMVWWEHKWVSLGMCSPTGLCVTHRSGPTLTGPAAHSPPPCWKTMVVYFHQSLFLHKHTRQKSMCWWGRGKRQLQGGQETHLFNGKISPALENSSWLSFEVKEAPHMCKMMLIHKGLCDWGTLCIKVYMPASLTGTFFGSLCLFFRIRELFSLQTKWHFWTNIKKTSANCLPPAHPQCTWKSWLLCLETTEFITPPSV